MDSFRQFIFNLVTSEVFREKWAVWDDGEFRIYFLISLPAYDVLYMTFAV